MNELWISNSIVTITVDKQSINYRKVSERNVM